MCKGQGTTDLWIPGSSPVAFSGRSAEILEIYLRIGLLAGICHSSAGFVVWTVSQSQALLEARVSNQGFSTTFCSGTVLTSSESSPHSRIITMTIGFTPHLMATPRRRPAENSLPGAPMSPTSLGNHTATDWSNSPSRPDLQFATHRFTRTQSLCV